MKAAVQFLPWCIFPLRRWVEVPPEQVHHAIQRAFAHWGLPKALRFDNGLPWASNSDVPSALSLYWRGLGMEITFGRPSVSTDNACVERTHQHVVNWAEPHRHTEAMWQKALDWAADLQRNAYPYDEQRRSRSEHFGATLEHSGRAFTNQDIDWQKVEDVLQPALFERTVAANGRVCILQQRLTVGRAYAGTTVLLRFANGYWLVCNAKLEELQRFPCADITKDKIQRGFYHPHKYYQNSNVVKELSP
jgi:hypothetical protein